MIRNREKRSSAWVRIESSREAGPELKLLILEFEYAGDFEHNVSSRGKHSMYSSNWRAALLKQRLYV